MFISPAQQMRTVPSFSIPGRQFEIGRLRSAWELCRSGRGGVVTLHGPVGVGRTELLDAFSEFADADGAQVLMAAGSPLERDFPLGIVRQLFQSPHLAPEIVSEAARLIENGVAAGPTPHWSSPEGGEGGEGGSRVRPTPQVLHGLSTLLLDFARETPLLLAVDDRQDADIQSLEFLLYLARRIRNARVLTVLRSREDMTPQEPFFDVDLAGQPHHERIRLSLFGPDVIADLMRARLGEEAAHRHTGEAHELTGGSPLLVRAVVDDQEAGSDRADLVVGENYRRGVMHCLHRIDAFALRVARGVAALGRPADPALRHATRRAVQRSISRARVSSAVTTTADVVRGLPGTCMSRSSWRRKRRPAPFDGFQSVSSPMSKYMLMVDSPAQQPLGEDQKVGWAVGTWVFRCLVVPAGFRDGRPSFERTGVHRRPTTGEEIRVS